MSRSWPTWAALPLILIAAVHLRTTFTIPTVAPPGADHVRFLGSDPWYHMRVVDNLLAQWPHRLRLDPLAQYPDPAALAVAPLYDYLTAGALRITGLASADPFRRDLAAAWIPALLGAAVCVPVFLLGRRMFGRAAGLTAAAWLAVMPGSFLRRSLLGFADHHVAEVLFSTVAVWLLLHCIAEREDGHAGRLRTAVGILAFGLALAAYLLTWVGGVYFLGVLGCCIAVVRGARHLRGQDEWTLARTVGVGAVVAWAAMTPLLGYPMMRDHVPPLLVLGAAAVVLDAIAALSRRFSAPRILYPLFAALAGLAAWTALDTFAPWVLGPTIARVRESISTGAELTVAEARPATWGYVLRTFGTSAALAPLGLLVLAVRFRKSASDSRLVLAVWSVASGIAMLRQQRFAYYVAVPAALLCGYLVARGGGLAGRLVGRAFRRISRRGAPSADGPRWLTVPVAGIVGAVLFAPSFTPAVIQASSASGPDAGWYDALTWMRRETPPPLGIGGRYRARVLGGPGYHHPDTAYGVLATWDRGYWITRIAHRIPNANPTQYGAAETARFLTTSRWKEAQRILRRLGTRYVVVDDGLPLRAGGSDDVTGDLVAQAEWSGVSASDWVSRFEVRSGSGRDVLVLYLPKYYRTIGARLATFRGEAVTPDSSTVVVTFDPPGAGSGMRRARAVKRFSTYEEAEAYRSALPGANHVLGSTDPRASCVPLRALPGFRLVYETPDVLAGARRTSRVKIFEVSSPAP